MPRYASFLRLATVLTATTLALPLAAQTAEDVEADVLSALATPLPITIVGPLLTPGVSVTPEGDGFRAVLSDTSMMGLFPFGEVTMLLTPLDGDRYRISDMTFPTEIDIPGFARITYSDMAIEGTWQADTRSYTELTWTISDLTLAPGGGGPGSISMGQMAFDVLKEPDDTDTESRFEIALSDLAVLGAGPEDIRAGRVRVLLAANGERPVDLYSVIREAILRSTMGDGGGDLMALGQSLLGNTYSTVALDLTGEDLDIRSRRAPDENFLTAGGMTARIDLRDVAPRDWGGAEIRVALQDVEQRDLAPEDSVLSLGEAVFSVRGAELPVADMLTMAMMLGDPPRGQPVPARVLVDGLLNFGALEIRTEGSEVELEAFDFVFTDGERELQPLFTGGYDSWSARVGIVGLNQDAGRIEFAVESSGGSFTPQQAMGPGVEPHVEAWFPTELQLHTAVSNLNEAFLKQLLDDVQIADLSEPVELVLPMVLYGSATVLDVASDRNVYETGLFRLTQSSDLQFYPTEIVSMTPYTGQVEVGLRGLDALAAYVDEQARATGAMRPDEASAVQSVFTVMSNLAEEADDGVLTWSISRDDIYEREIVVNGVTLRYPNIAQLMPMLMFGQF